VESSVLCKKDLIHIFGRGGAGLLKAIEFLMAHQIPVVLENCG